MTEAVAATAGAMTHGDVSSRCGVSEMASPAEDNIDCEFPASKRAAPRLPLSLPGTFISTQGNHRCIVTNLSRTGVLIAIHEPLRVNDAGFLRCGPIDHFVIVQREGIGQNAMTFEIPVSDTFVAQVREYKANFEDQELHELRSIAQEWAGQNNTNA